MPDYTIPGPFARNRVRVRWQFAHTTSHFSISASTEASDRRPALERLKRFCPRTWSKSMHHGGKVPPQSMHGHPFAAAITARNSADVDKYSARRIATNSGAFRRCHSRCQSRWYVGRFSRNCRDLHVLQKRRVLSFRPQPSHSRSIGFSGSIHEVYLKPLWGGGNA